MSFTWKKFMLFGMVASIPVLAFTVKKLADNEREVFGHHHAGMVTCDVCPVLFQARAGARWIMHLQDAHGMTLDDAIDITKNIYYMLLIRKARRIKTELT